MHFESQGIFGIFGPLIFWALIPSLATRIIAAGLSRLTGSSSIPHKPIYCAIVVLSLSFSLIQTEATMPLNYYDLLHLKPDAPDIDIRQSYRRLSRIMHPDKILQYPQAEQDSMSTRYIEIQKSYETLKTPLTRYAYDKFGPNIIKSCQNCKNKRDYIMQSITFLIFYASSAVVTLLLLVSGRLDYGTFWRCSGLIVMAWLECGMLLGEEHWTDGFFRWRTVHEKVQIMHHVGVTWCMALSQIGPTLFPYETIDIKAVMSTIYEQIDMVDAESMGGLKHTFAPFREENAKLQEKMQELLCKHGCMESLDQTV